MTTTRVLRPATPDDLLLLRHWDEQPHTVASDPGDDWGWETELARQPSWREQLIAELDGRPIGFIQIIDPAEEDSHYWGEIAPGYRAHRFYERLGFRYVENRTFDEDNCRVYRLNRADWATETDLS